MRRFGNFRQRPAPVTAATPAGRPTFRILVVLTALVLVGAGLFIYGPPQTPVRPAHGRAAAAPPPGNRPSAARDAPRAKIQAAARHRVASTPAQPFAPPSQTLLATTDGTIAKFAYPGGPRSGSVPGSWHEGRSTLPVIAHRPGWLDVRLAQRPNESTAWVLSRDVKLSVTPYAIVVDLASRHLQLYRDGRQILSAPVGVGTSQYPTPTGTFFAAFFAAPPSPGYGAFVIVTSAHSNVITDWDMSGDAMVAIHGPLGSAAAIGTTGAQVSHGCVRMHENDLMHLRDVPVGSPIYIFAS